MKTPYISEASDLRHALGHLRPQESGLKLAVEV